MPISNNGYFGNNNYMKTGLMKKYIFISVICIAVSSGCTLLKKMDKTNMSKENYFSSPKEAVRIITELLKAKNFKILEG